MALEKDRTRRYESANDLAKDVQRYLDDEAVEACPPSTAYRLGKFYRRNKVALLTAASFAIVLILGLFGTTWQAVRATLAEKQERNQAEIANEQRQRAETNLTLAMQTLDEVYLKAIGEERLLREDTLSFDGGITAPVR